MYTIIKTMVIKKNDLFAKIHKHSVDCPYSICIVCVRQVPILAWGWGGAAP